MNNTKPLYIQIKESLISDIKSGKYNIGNKIPGETDISSQLNVSIGIVRKAILEMVDEGILIRRPRHGTTVYNIPGQDIKKAATKTIGVIFTNFLSQYMSSLLDGINQCFHEMGYHLIVCNSFDDPKYEMELVDQLIERNVDGMIIFPAVSERAGRVSISHYKKIKRLNIPFVLVDRYMKSLDSNIVSYNDYEASKALVKRAINLGHKRIGFITRNVYATTVINRHNGYKDALLEAKIEYDPNIVLYYNDTSLSENIEKFYSMGVTCIFCLTDFYAFNLALAIKKSRFLYPGDFSIICFGSSEGVELIEPAITRVIMNSQLMGIKSAEIILDNINNPNDSNTLRITLPYEIYNGNSIKDLR